MHLPPTRQGRSLTSLLSRTGDSLLLSDLWPILVDQRSSFGCVLLNRRHVLLLDSTGTGRREHLDRDGLQGLGCPFLIAVLCGDNRHDFLLGHHGWFDRHCLGFFGHYRCFGLALRFLSFCRDRWCFDRRDFPYFLRGLLPWLFLAIEKFFYLVVVLLTENCSALFSFEKQVVGGGEVIESIFLNFVGHLFRIQVVVFLERCQDFLLDGNRVPPDDHTGRVGRLMLNLVVPGVSADVLDCVALFRVGVQDFCYQILTLGREEIGYLIFGLDDFLIQLLRVLVLKWQVATNHSVENHAARPDVRTKSVVALTPDHLGRGVAGTPAGCLQRFAFLVQITQAEVNQLDVVVVVEQKIFGLQVAVHDPQLVDVLDAREDLRVHLAGLFLGQAPVLDDVLKKLAAGTVLHDEVEVVVVFDHLYQ